MRELILYHTSGCHLCEMARDIIWPCLSGSDFKLVEIDIADSDDLIQSYGVRIPVLFCDGRELGWPFDGRQLQQFLNPVG